MIKFSSALLALGAALLPVAAHASEPATVFEHEGQRYVYTTEVSGARTLIRGYVEKGYAPFELTVQNGRVSGTVDGRPVSFRTSEATKVETTQVAAR